MSWLDRKALVSIMSKIAVTEQIFAVFMLKFPVL